MNIKNAVAKQHVGALMWDSAVVWIPLERSGDCYKECMQAIISVSSWRISKTIGILGGYTVIKLKNK